MVPVGIKDISTEDLFWLANIQDKEYMGAENVLKKLAAQELQVWRILGEAKGILISYIEGERILVYFLHGDGIHAKEVKRMAEILLRLSKALGLKGLKCISRDLAKARLFLTTGGKVEYIEMILDGE